jgi:hypothetical protein
VYPLPDDGRVRFYARTFDGLMVAEANEKTLGQQRHRLSPLFLSAHAVISAIRESDAGKYRTDRPQQAAAALTAGDCARCPRNHRVAVST